MRSFDFSMDHSTKPRGTNLSDETDKRTPLFPGAISRILVQQAILGLQADKTTKLQHLFNYFFPAQETIETMRVHRPKRTASSSMDGRP